MQRKKVYLFMFSSIKIRKGFSLIEMLLVLGVLAVLLIAAFVVYPRVKLSQQVHQEKANIFAIQTGIRSALLNQGGSFEALGFVENPTGNVFTNRARIVPSNMNGGDYSGSEILNGWGGRVVVHSTVGAFGGYTRGRTFGIQYNEVPKEACVQFVTETIGNFVAVWINGSTGAGTYLTPNSSVGKIIERCEVQPIATVHFVSD